MRTVSLILKMMVTTMVTMMIIGCSANPVEVGDFGERLKFGRKISYAAATTSGGFGLKDDPSVVSKEYDQQTGSLTTITFDTSKIPRTDYFQVDADCLKRASDFSEEMLLDPLELRTAEKLLQRISDSLIAVSYIRFSDDKLVRDSHFQCIYTDLSDGTVLLRELINRTYAGHNVENTSTESADFSKIAAATGKNLALTGRRSLIVPMHDQDGRVGLWHAIEFLATDLDSDEKLTISVAADSGKILEAFSNRYAAVYTVKGDVFDRTYLNSVRKPASIPLPEIIDGVNTLRADHDGELTSETLGSTLSLRLASERVRVVNAAVSTTQIMTIPATTNGDNEIKLNPDANGLIGLSGYVSILKINEFVRRHLTPSQASILGRNIMLSINVTGNCNAFYDGNISMFRAGNGCENTALINDVIYHEWGHGLDAVLGTNAGITDGAFSEGIGDILSAFYVNDSNMAPGFLVGQSAGIRNLKNTRRFPTDRGAVHLEGQIIGGAFWDMREALVKRYGAVKGAFHAEHLFFRHLLTTDSYMDSYAAVLRLDDNDGNPATKSPNFCLINTAFAAHGIATLEANCTDTPVKDAYDINGLSLKLDAGPATAFLASGKDFHYMHLCFDTKLACLTAKKEDLKLDRAGTIGDLVLFQAVSNRTIAANSNLTLIGSDAYGSITAARSFKLMGR